MKAETARIPQVKLEEALQPITPAEFNGRVEEMFASIARRAYEFFESRGQEHGKDLEDWFHAEREHFEAIRIDLAESGDILTASADVPSFRSDDLAISIEPRRLTVAGKKEAEEGGREEETNHTAQGVKYALGALDLPVDVDPSQVRTTMKESRLVISLPKAVAPNNRPGDAVKEA